MRLPVLLLCAALVPATALADNTADEADTAFSIGNASFLKRDFERALASYFLSYRLVPNDNVLFNIARCYEALNRLDEAYRYYHDLSVRPSLDEADRREVSQALARLAPKTALLSVASDPPGAEVFVDRVDLGSRGRTPLLLAVPAGTHKVRVELAGYRPAEAGATLERGRTAAQAFALERVLGKVELECPVAGAVVRESAEGPELAALPASLPMTPGQKLLFVSAPGYLPAQVLVDVRPDAVATARVTLVEKPKPTGKVVVTSNRDGALVRVDGRDSGFTPVVLVPVEGRHVVEVSSDDTEPFRRELDVAADSETRLYAELRYVPPPVHAASQFQLAVDEAPASVTVITQEELRAFGYQTLPEALQAVRGFYFTDDRIYSYIGLRGLSPSGDFNTRILILWDGHPMNDAWLAQGFCARDLDVDLGEVDRIEIVRGPASILYGSGAVFGVVNVVPRERVGGGRTADASVGAGGQNGAKVRATGGLGGDERGVLLGAAVFDSKGAEVTDVPGQGPMRGSDGELALGASARAHWGPFSVAGKANRRVKQVPTAPGDAEFGLPGTNYMDERAFAEGRFQKELGRLLLDVRGAYDHYWYVGKYARSDSPVEEAGGAEWAGAEVRAGVRLSEGNRLGLSMQGQAQWIRQVPSGSDQPQNVQRTFLSATVLDEWHLHPRVFVQAGVRADKYMDLEQIALSPRAALVLRPYEGGLTKLIAGRAFRAPTVYENYVSDQVPGGPWPAPGPEIITTLEAEHSHDLTPGLRLTGGAFFNLVQGLIRMGTANPDPCDSQYCNPYSNSAADVSAAGLELHLRWQPGRFTLVEGSYSYVALGGPGRTEASAYPTHLGSARALLPLRQGFVRLAAEATYQSNRCDEEGHCAGESVLANLGLSGDFGSVRWFAGVRNLLDERFRVPIAFESGNGMMAQYGRSFWVELGAGL